MSTNSSGALSLFSTEHVVAPRRRDRWTLSAYQRLDQDQGHIASNVRQLLDEWYHRLPTHARTEIRQRFVNPAPGAHLGAFWEMYLHEMVSRADFGVDIDVGRDHAGRRPDILVERQGASFFLEATVALGDGAVDPTERARAEQLYAAIERVNNRNFLLHTELRKVGQSTPGRKLIADPLDRWLAGLDPDDLRRQAEAGEPAPAITINEQGWIVQIEATGLKPELRGDASAGVIGSRMEGFATDADGEDLVAKLDDIRPLTNVLLKKAGHGYELNDRPFVIAVLCAGDFVDDHDIAQALFGRLEYRISMDSDRSVGRYVPGGLWHGRTGPRYRSVSAVLTARNLTPGAIAAVEPRLWLNPDASRPINPNALPWASWEIATGGQLIEHPATRTAADLFGLARHWPASDRDTAG